MRNLRTRDVSNVDIKTPLQEFRLRVVAQVVHMVLQNASKYLKVILPCIINLFNQIPAGYID